MYLAPLQLRESVFAVVCDRAKNDLSILTIFRRFPSRDVISQVLSNVLLGITDPDAGGVSMIIEAGGTNRDMVITSHQSHTPALSLWTLTGSHRPVIVTVSRVTWSRGHEGAITFQLSIWFVTRLRLSCAQVTNQENTATAAETSEGFLHFKIMVLIINTKTGNGHTLALLPRLPLNTARHQPADRLTQHKMVT